jgi:Domain of unknown function (DUF4386)
VLCRRRYADAAAFTPTAPFEAFLAPRRARSDGCLLKIRAAERGRVLRVRGRGTRTRTTGPRFCQVASARLLTVTGERGQAVSLDQKRARVFGVLYLITFVTSIPALALYQPVLDHPVGYIASAGQNNRILFGALLELLLIIANIGTAVVIFPIVKRQSEELALGYVAARLFECMFILVGIVAVLGIVTLQQEVAGAAEGSTAYTLAAIKDWTFLLGPGWVVGWGNGLILGYLMYSSGLVPRQMAWLGLVGGALIILSGTLVLFDVADKGGTFQAIATIPESLWELSLGIYCTLKGFRPSSPILRPNAREDRMAPMPAASRA